MSEERTDNGVFVDLPLNMLRMMEEEFTSLHGPLPVEYLAAPDHERPTRLKALLHERGRAALCLSGGGIRSATFALGVIQGLAKRGLVSKFDYLSTVSGGGYIGSWLSAWTCRAPHGIKGVETCLSKGFLKTTIDTNLAGAHAIEDDPIGSGGVGANPDSEGADPRAIGHLRRYSNYLTPKLGLMSADTWTVAALYLRNLLVNWAVIIPLLLAVLMLPRLCIPCTQYTGTTPPWMWAILATGIVLLVAAMTVTGLSVPSVAIDRLGCRRGTLEHNARHARLGQGGFLRGVLLPLVAADVALSTAWAFFRNDAGINGAIPPWWLFVVAGMGLYFLTLLCTLAFGLLPSLGANLRVYLRPDLFVVFAVVGALGGLLTFLAAAYLFPVPKAHPRLYATFAMPSLVFIHFLTGTLYVALTSRTSDPRDDEDREWWARAAGWLLVTIFAWSLFSAIVLVVPALFTKGLWQKLGPIVGALAGGATMFLSASSKTSAGSDEGNRSKGLTSLIYRGALGLTAPIFIVFLVAGLSFITDALLAGSFPSDPAQHRTIVVTSEMLHMAGWTIGLILIGILGARLININKFSMHSMYRNRLIRAYLGASRERHPNHFTGFDADDNLQMYSLRAKTVGGEPVLSECNLRDVPGLLRLLRDNDHWLSARIWPLCTNAASLGVDHDHSTEMMNALLNDLNSIVTGSASIRNSTTPASGDPASAQEKTAARFGKRHRKSDGSKSIDANGYLYKGGHDWFHLPRSVIRRVRPADGCFSPGDPTMTERNLHLLEHVYEGHILPGAQRPLHVVNLALNIAGDDQLAWQERKAESFSVSPLHCGNHRLGYRRSLFYGGPDGISLGTAVTISGAAVSPNMGYHSSAPMALLMTFFNVRLGWWLGNPGLPGAPHDPSEHGASARLARAMNRFLSSARQRGMQWASTLDPRSYRQSAPRFSIAPVVREAFGLTDETSKYIYLSDGGHFENLGLYEMVLRRCRVIVLSDAGCDPRCAFEDLGNAIRKIRVDLGIEIEIDLSRIRSRESANQTAGKHCAIGLIRYKNADGAKDDGLLIYIKPSLLGDEPADVQNYARTNKEFPHESTGDQWFSESQFESYRALGEHTVDRICSGGSPIPPKMDWSGGLQDFVRMARSYVAFGTRTPEGESISP